MIDLEEKKYLDHVLEKINVEIAKEEEKLRELCKTGISLSFEDRKRGEHFNINAKASDATERIESLKQSIPTPYFGRIDFSSSNSDKSKKIYIGRKGISSDTESLVTDWRAPISSLYYDSELGDVAYNSPMGVVTGKLNLKRQITIKDSELIDVQDTSLVTNDELLKPYLSTNADNKMKTIIASIQKEQNQIIRKPITNNIIVQGVAGSGKTSVALHRIAYLIYALENKIKSTEFLIIGPNKYFLNYISSILPELETSPVEQKTLLEILNDLLNEKLIIDETVDVSEETKIVRNFKASLRYKNALDKFIKDYLDFNIVSKGIVIDGEEIFSKQEIRNLLFTVSSNYSNFDSACNYFVKKYKDNMNEIYEKLNEKYRRVYINLPKNDPKRIEAIEESQKLYDFIKNKGVKYIREYFKKLNVKILDLYKVFVANIQLYVDDISETEIKALQNNTLGLLRKKKISFEDMAPLLHLNYKLHGNDNQYHHIVIDEAQDYGLFHFAVLKEMFPSSTFSIYGDLAQSIYSYRSIENWEEVENVIFNGDCELINIDRSYRTTAEITENANNILYCLGLPDATPVIRHGDSVLFEEKTKNNKYKVNKILELQNQGYKTIAIICKNEKEAKKVYDNLINENVDATHITAKDTEYNGGICVLTSALAKGLEFDAVIINDASSNTYDITNKTDMHLLYVACTRALHKLEILYDRELCPVFNVTRELPCSRKLVK